MDKFSILCIVLAGVSWGTTGVFTTFLREYGFEPLHMASARNLIAAVVMLLGIMLGYRKGFRVQKTDLPALILGGISLYATGAFYYACMETTSLSTAVVLMYTAPIIVMLVSVFFLGEQFNWKKLMATLFALVGCGLVTGMIGGIRISTVGIVLGFLCAIAYSSYNICTKVAMRQGTNPIGATMYYFLFASIIALGVGRVHEIPRLITDHPIPSLWLLFGLGIITTVVPYLFYTFAMRKVPAGVASAMASIEPLTATVISIVFFQEKLTVYSLLGMCLILSAVIIVAKK